MNTITTIIFDFGGVLMDWNPRYAYKPIFKDDEKMEWFLENICTDEWNIEQDRGRTLKEGTQLLQKQHPEYHDLIQAYYDNWETMLHSDIPESVEILKILAAKYPTYGLTNWSAETFPIAYKKYSHFQLFKGILVSGEEKLIKPNPEIYKLMLKRFDLDAENSLFIDDNIKNIEAAKELNFNCIHFHSPEQ